MELPPLLSAKHIMFIFDCSRPKANAIMNEPHRPVWNPERKPGEMLRLHRDLFLSQLEQESRQANQANMPA